MVHVLKNSSPKTQTSIQFLIYTLYQQVNLRYERYSVKGSRQVTNQASSWEDAQSQQYIKEKKKTTRREVLFNTLFPKVICIESNSLCLIQQNESSALYICLAIALIVNEIDFKANIKCVMANFACQFDRIWNCLGDKPLGMSVRKFQDWIN